MLKNTIVTKEDLEEGLKLQRRQQYEDERKKRIFNAKQRLFGVDIPALERQIEDNKQKRAAEFECQKRYDEQVKMQDLAVRSRELSEGQRKRIMQSDLNYYRCRFQRNDQRREYDLNDPNYLKHSQPARICDDDPRLGISSAQVFDGEDLHWNERKQRQFAQQRAWLDQQVLERKQAEEARRQADKQWQGQIAAHDSRLADMALSERRVHNETIGLVSKYNQELAKQKQVERERWKQAQKEDDMAEIYNMLTSDMLTENPDVAQSRLDPKKKIAFMYRGMSPEELATFREEQRRQRISNEQRSTEEKLMNSQWEQYALNMDRELKIKERDVRKREKQLFEDMIEFNRVLAERQRAQRVLDDQVMNRNEVFPEFYEQFNKTTR